MNKSEHIICNGRFSFSSTSFWFNTILHCLACFENILKSPFKCSAEPDDKSFARSIYIILMWGMLCLSPEKGTPLSRKTQRHGVRREEADFAVPHVIITSQLSFVHQFLHADQSSSNLSVKICRFTCCFVFSFPKSPILHETTLCKVVEFPLAFFWVYSPQPRT